MMISEPWNADASPEEKLDSIDQDLELLARQTYLLQREFELTEQEAKLKRSRLV